ncbi:MAG TPA: hypothetical protein VKY74_24315 [Chloroflexia bacterium]|nr:hypothetical protein [Chloroflexia bacterium]
MGDNKDTQSKDEVESVAGQASDELSDDELETVAGGGGCLKPLNTSGCTGH